MRFFNVNLRLRDTNGGAFDGGTIGLKGRARNLLQWAVGFQASAAAVVQASLAED